MMLHLSMRCNEKMMADNSSGLSTAYGYYKYGPIEENTPSVTIGNTTTPVTASMIASATPGYIIQNISSLFGPATTKDNDKSEYIFDRPDIKAMFIAIYTAVFCFCFFGNLLVILVVTMSRRLRSFTNFFLANLAFADLCVGVFCVFQNLSIYLIPSWIFGDFMCKMYQFIHSLSYTASIFILVVICTERYFAIIHPITCKQILTPSRLKIVIAGVWLTSAAYSAPKFIWVQTITNKLGDNQTETICISHRKKYDSELFDIINFGFLYVTPLSIMLVLYTRIAICLWKTSQGLGSQTQIAESSTPVTCRAVACPRHSAPKYNIDNQQTRPDKHNCKLVVATWRTRGRAHGQFPQLSHLSQNVLRARKGVIRMLIIVVLTFAICNLPFHARKLWQNWSSSYEGGSNFSTLLTPLTFLITYFNSGINPLLYAFLSRNFRRGMRELILCHCRGSQKKQQRQQLLEGNSSNNGPSLNGHSSQGVCSSISVPPTSSDMLTG